MICVSTIGNFSGQMNAGNVAAVATTGCVNNLQRKALNDTRLGFAM